MIWEACALSPMHASSPAWIFFGRFRRASQGRMNSKAMLERQCKVRICILIRVSRIYTDYAASDLSITLIRLCNKLQF